MGPPQAHAGFTGRTSAPQHRDEKAIRSKPQKKVSAGLSGCMVELQRERRVAAARGLLGGRAEKEGAV